MASGVDTKETKTESVVKITKGRHGVTMCDAYFPTIPQEVSDNARFTAVIAKIRFENDRYYIHITDDDNRRFFMKFDFEDFSMKYLHAHLQKRKWRRVDVADVADPDVVEVEPEEDESDEIEVKVTEGHRASFVCSNHYPSKQAHVIASDAPFTNVIAKIRQQDGRYHLRIDDGDNLPFWMEFDFAHFGAQMLEEYVATKQMWRKRTKTQ